MSQEPAAPAGGENPSGQEPPTGQDPNTPSNPPGQQDPTNAGGQEPKVFDEEYVKTLRSENAKLRTQNKEFEDRDKTEQQKLEDRATDAERRADAAERKLLRFEVAAEKGVPLDQAHRLQGDTKEELAADAEKFKQSFTPPSQTPDPGAGPRTPVSPETSMDDLIRHQAGMT